MEQENKFPYSKEDVEKAGTEEISFDENYDINNIDLTKEQEARARAMMGNDSKLNFEQATIQVLKEDLRKEQGEK